MELMEKEYNICSSDGYLELGTVGQFMPLSFTNSTGDYDGILPNFWRTFGAMKCPKGLKINKYMYSRVNGTLYGQAISNGSLFCALEGSQVDDDDHNNYRVTNIVYNEWADLYEAQRVEKPSTVLSSITGFSFPSTALYVLAIFVFSQWLASILTKKAKLLKNVNSRLLGWAIYLVSAPIVVGQTMIQFLYSAAYAGNAMDNELPPTTLTMLMKLFRSGARSLYLDEIYFSFENTEWHTFMGEGRLPHYTTAHDALIKACEHQSATAFVYGSHYRAFKQWQQETGYKCILKRVTREDTSTGIPLIDLWMTLGQQRAFILSKKVPLNIVYELNRLIATLFSEANVRLMGFMDYGIDETAPVESKAPTYEVYRFPLLLPALYVLGGVCVGFGVPAFLLEMAWNRWLGAHWRRKAQPMLDTHVLPIWRRLRDKLQSVDDILWDYVFPPRTGTEVEMQETLRSFHPFMTAPARPQLRRHSLPSFGTQLNTDPIPLPGPFALAPPIPAHQPPIPSSSSETPILTDSPREIHTPSSSSLAPSSLAPSPPPRDYSRAHKPRFNISEKASTFL